METEAEQRAICFTMDSRVKDAYVLGDPEGIRQIFDNLIGNAIKYSSDGGQVTVSVETDAEERIIVAISDTGIGIDQTSQARIFERFYRVDKGRSRELGGTGLGLSIVKHAVSARRRDSPTTPSAARLP